MRINFPSLLWFEYAFFIPSYKKTDFEIRFFNVKQNLYLSYRAETVVIPLPDACLAVVDGPSADAELGADFRLHHAIHVAIQNGKFQVC